MKVSDVKFGLSVTITKPNKVANFTRSKVGARFQVLGPAANGAGIAMWADGITKVAENSTLKFFAIAGKKAPVAAIPPHGKKSATSTAQATA